MASVKFVESAWGAKKIVYESYKYYLSGVPIWNPEKAVVEVLLPIKMQ